MSSSVSLKLRKEMLLMRASVERVELAHHMLEVRRAASINAIVRNLLPNDRSRGWVTRAVEMAKRYPVVMSAASLLATRFKIPLVKSAVKLGGVAAVGYKLWEAWQRQRVLNERARARTIRTRMSS